MITTAFFRIKPASFVRKHMTVWLSRWWWTIALPLAILIVAGSYNMIYYVAALALLLIVAPGVLALVYLSYALTPHAAFMTLEHRVIFQFDDINIEFKHVDGVNTPSPLRYTLSQVSAVEDLGDALRIALLCCNLQYIDIPAYAFAPGDMVSCMQKLNRGVLAQNLP